MPASARGGGDDGLEPERVLAILFYKWGITKDEFLDMNDWDAYNWMFRPSTTEDPSKGYWPVGRLDPLAGEPLPLTFREMYYRHWRKLQPAITDEELEAKFKAWFKGYKGP